MGLLSVKVFSALLIAQKTSWLNYIRKITNKGLTLKRTSALVGL